ncbi:hypothetical protein [Pedobacter sp.]
MKIFLIKLTLVLSVFFQQINIDILKKDPILIKYKQLMNDLKEGQLNRRYVLPNNPNVMKSFYSNPTKENMKKILNAEGMENANEYVDKIFLQTTLMFEFLKKHPEISKLENKKKQELIRELLYD